MLRLRVFALIFALVGSPLLWGQAALQHRFETVEIQTSKTSIYIGSVTLALDPLVRKNGAYESLYSASVFPYFFYNEKGRLSIEISDEALLRVSRLEPVDFTGLGISSDGEERRITGRATPTDPAHGKIKVRIFVSKRIALIFNTTYEIKAGAR